MPIKDTESNRKQLLKVMLTCSAQPANGRKFHMK
jgi:hypothetical protein